MPHILGIDHKFFMISTFAATAGLAAYSTYKWHSLVKRRQKENPYESENLPSQYLNLHYGAPEDLSYVFNHNAALEFPKRCADLCIKYFTQEADVPSRALDIGCAVGRSTFELTREFHEVIGIDNIQLFIDTCSVLKQDGHITNLIQTVGELRRQVVAEVDTTIDRSKASFMQGDPCDLLKNLGQFGCVLAANLLCRVNNARQFLQRLYTLVSPGGILVISSTYTFLTEFTPREEWRAGFLEEDKETTGFDGLKSALSAGFDLMAEEEMPCLIRVTERMHYLVVYHTTVWKRKSS